MIYLEPWLQPLFACEYSPQNTPTGRDLLILWFSPAKSTWSFRRHLAVTITRLRRLPAIESMDSSWVGHGWLHPVKVARGDAFSLHPPSVRGSRLLPRQSSSSWTFYDLLNSKTWLALLQTCKTHKCTAMQSKQILNASKLSIYELEWYHISTCGSFSGKSAALPALWYTDNVWLLKKMPSWNGHLIHYSAAFVSFEELCFWKFVSTWTH